MELLLLAGCVGVPVVIAVVTVIVVMSRGKGNPDLFPCPGCGRQVHRLAPTCPGCGRPLNP